MFPKKILLSKNIEPFIQTEMLKQKADQYIPTTKLRYLFAVDTSYVFQKLKIITLPWIHSDWMLKYQTDANNPVAPR